MKLLALFLIFAAYCYGLYYGYREGYKAGLVAQQRTVAHFASAVALERCEADLAIAALVSPEVEEPLALEDIRAAR